jgi:hypothetical protein
MSAMPFNETQFLKLIFLLSDTQQWLNELNKQLIDQLPLENKKKLNRKTWNLTITALAHILERHYYQIPRHPGTGKFHIPIADILMYLRDAQSIEPSPVPGTNNLQRTLECPEKIGFDKYGNPTNCITIITDNTGNIITAFPGTLIPLACLA